MLNYVEQCEYAHRTGVYFVHLNAYEFNFAELFEFPYERTPSLFLWWAVKRFFYIWIPSS